MELYCNSTAFRKLLTFLTYASSASNVSLTDPSAGLGLRLAVVHLVDSHYCTDAGKFISVLLTSLVAMLQLSLPHVNVLSKIDLVELYGRLPFNLDFFAEVLNLSHLVEQLEVRYCIGYLLCDWRLLLRWLKIRRLVGSCERDQSGLGFYPSSIALDLACLRRGCFSRLQILRFWMCPSILPPKTSVWYPICFTNR